MVVVLSGSDGTGALDERSRVKVLEWFSRGRGSGSAPGWATAPFPKERLAGFKELLRRVTRSKDAGGFGPREPLRLNGDQVADLHRLHWARNQYAHFTPKTWTVEGAYLAPLVLVACAVTRALMDESHVRVRLEDADRERLHKALTIATEAASDWS